MSHDARLYCATTKVDKKIHQAYNRRMDETTTIRIWRKTFTKLRKIRLLLNGLSFVAILDVIADEWLKNRDARLVRQHPCISMGHSYTGWDGEFGYCHTCDRTISISEVTK